MSQVLLFSGGLDSFIAWSLLGHPRCLYVGIGHRYEAPEIRAITALCTTHPELEIKWDFRLFLGDHEEGDGHIPFRNLLLAAAGALYADTVYLGALAGEASQDKSASFFKDTSKLLSTLRGRPVAILAPFRHLTKTELVGQYLKAGLPVEALFETRSCYSRDAIACGQCQACFRRWVAMKNNGIVEAYAHSPAEWMRDKLTTETATLALDVKELKPQQWMEALRNNFQALRALQRDGKRFPK